MKFLINRFRLSSCLSSTNMRLVPSKLRPSSKKSMCTILRNLSYPQIVVFITYYDFKIFQHSWFQVFKFDRFKAFSSRWGNFRRSYFITSPGQGYRGNVAPFRIEKEAKEPRRELRLNFSRLQPKTVLRIIGESTY